MKVYFKGWLMVLALVLAALAMITLATQPARAAGPWYVGPGGSDSNTCLSPVTRCATINGALNKPGFVAGDTIRVATGTYTGTGSEVVLLNKNATLSGGWDAGFTTQSGMSTIDGQNSRRGITVNGGVTATVERFTVQNGLDNFSFSGGGIQNSGILTLINSTISSNTVGIVGYSGGGGGGGIYNSGGTLTLNNSTVSDNIILGGFNGGGIYNFGTLILNNSTVGRNTAPYGGGIYNLFSGSLMTLNNSTVSGNNGDGINNYLGTANFNNSTVSGNNGGGIDNLGTLILNNSTVSNNTRASGTGGTGGIANSGTVTMQNSILAMNTSDIGVSNCGGSIGSSGYNLIENTANCTFIPTSSDLTNTDAKLGPLEGSLGYHPLLPGSPAINAGNPAGCMGSTGLLTTDQRGFPRFGTCDIGAYEMQPIEFSTKTVNQPTAAPGDPLTYTVALNNGGATNITNVRVTDTLPISLTYISGSLTATGGSYGYNSGVITWTGSVNAGGAVTITFGAIISDNVLLGTIITNTAIISGAGSIFERSAATTVRSGAPEAGTIYLPLLARNYCPPWYVDYFSDPGSGWPIDDTGDTRYEYLNGEYRILVKNTYLWAGARPGFKASDYIVAVDVRNATGVYGTYGFIFGLSDDWSQFYTFEVDPNGGYVIWRYNSSSGWTALANGSSGYINPGTATNRLKVERNGSLIRAYANGQLLASVSDGSYTGSRHVGLIVSSYSQPNVDARFDNFAVYPVTCGAAATALSEVSAAGVGFEMGEPGVHEAPMPPGSDQLP